jgi:hypothetical protein
MVKKTIRGVVTTTHLDEGETADVEVTPLVQGLIDNGYIEVVDGDGGGKKAHSGGEQAARGSGVGGGKD